MGYWSGGKWVVSSVPELRGDLRGWRGLPLQQSALRLGRRRLLRGRPAGAVRGRRRQPGVQLRDVRLETLLPDLRGKGTQYQCGS